MDDNSPQPSTYLELVELANGDIVLRRTDNKNDQMVSIRFSSEVMEMLSEEIRMTIARRMVYAGIETFNEMNENAGAAFKATMKTPSGIEVGEKIEADRESGHVSGDDPEPTIH